MRKVIITLLASTFALAAVPAFAGNSNKSSSTAKAVSRNENINQNINGGNDVSIRNRMQPGNVSSFGGAGCPEGFSISVPGGGFSVQTQCREGKQAVKAQTVDTYFDRKAARDWLCATDKDLYGIDYCVKRRVMKSGVVQARDRAKYANR